MHNRVTALGYIGLEVSDPEAWDRFATETLGFESVAGPDESRRYRIDEYGWRFGVHHGERDDIVYAGFEAPDSGALCAIELRLVELGVDVSRGSTVDCSTRGVTELVRCADPDGLAVEIFVGADVAFERPFTSPRPLSGFETDGLGLGHIVISTTALEDARRFYEEGLGFKLSDYATLGPTQMAFLHCNKRHHTIALVPVEAPTRLFHFMVQARELDDVGRVLDAATDAGVTITRGLGKHTNDHMVSFYVHAPPGFEVEFGFGAREVDDDWQVVHHHSASIWGHRPPPHTS
jgi:2,3-dihydroxybiphenyl 1,2-dioxygenase